MIHQLGKIRKHNLKAHDDIERDIQGQQNGLLTFTLRVNGGNIVDYNVVEYVDARQYLRDELVIKESTISLYYRTRG